MEDISAFYLPHFTFFISFKMFLARFACHTAKMNGEKKRWTKKYSISYKNNLKKRREKPGSERKMGRFRRASGFNQAEAIEEIVDNFCSLS